jgi:hypothetical protein
MEIRLILLTGFECRDAAYYSIPDLKGWFRSLLDAKAP